MIRWKLILLWFAFMIPVFGLGLALATILSKAEAVWVYILFAVVAGGWVYRWRRRREMAVSCWGERWGIGECGLSNADWGVSGVKLGKGIGVIWSRGVALCRARGVGMVWAGAGWSVVAGGCGS